MYLFLQMYTSNFFLVVQMFCLPHPQFREKSQNFKTLKVINGPLGRPKWTSVCSLHFVGGEKTFFYPHFSPRMHRGKHFICMTSLCCRSIGSCDQNFDFFALCRPSTSLPNVQFLFIWKFMRCQYLIH